MFKITLRDTSCIPINVEGILPSVVNNLREADVARLPIRYGSVSLRLGDLFKVELNPRFPNADIHFAGDTRHVQAIAKGMNSGFIYVENSVGRHAGANMNGGKLIIDTDADHWLGAEMSGGSIEVRGNVGSQAGAAYQGSRRGMTGGRITITGNAGDEVGLLMRRGHIWIAGNCGSFAGASMIAGTIIVQGSLGAHAGAGMKRGTIITPQPPQLSPGFQFVCEYGPQYMHLLNEQFRGSGYEMIHEDNEVKSVRCYRGDLLTSGRGEIWHAIH